MLVSYAYPVMAGDPLPRRSRREGGVRNACGDAGESVQRHARRGAGALHAAQHVGAEGVGSAVSGAALVPVDTLEGYVEWLPADPWRTGSSGFGRLNRAMPVTVREQPVPAAMAGPPSASLAYGG